MQEDLHDDGQVQRPARRLQAGDGAVVVGSPDVDGMIEAPLDLVEEVGGVRHEIGGPAVGADEDAVAVVAELGGTEPDGAVLLEGDAGIPQPVEGFGQLAAVVERLFREPGVRNGPRNAPAWP